jgi:hypothetical protein
MAGSFSGHIDLEKRGRGDRRLRIIHGLMDRALIDLSSAFDALNPPSCFAGLSVSALMTRYGTQSPSPQNATASSKSFPPKDGSGPPPDRTPS